MIKRRSLASQYYANSTDVVRQFEFLVASTLPRIASWMHGLSKSPRRGLAGGFSEENIPRCEIHCERSTRNHRQPWYAEPTAAKGAVVRKASGCVLQRAPAAGGGKRAGHCRRAQPLAAASSEKARR